VAAQSTGRVGCREKNVRYAGGSEDDEMHMITASFSRAIERFSGDLDPRFLLLFQQVVATRKTGSRLRERKPDATVDHLTVS